MDDAVRFMDVVVAGLWVALAVAIGVLALAGLAVVGRFVSTRLERRYLPGVSRWSRRRASLAEDAGPWACPACRSVSASTVLHCYRCGTARPVTATELAPAATDPSVFHRPEPVNRFDPGLYRGPGAPPTPVAPGPVAATPAPPAAPPAPEPGPAAARAVSPATTPAPGPAPEPAAAPPAPARAGGEPAPDAPAPATAEAPTR